MRQEGLHVRVDEVFVGSRGEGGGGSTGMHRDKGVF